MKSGKVNTGSEIVKIFALFSTFMLGIVYNLIQIKSIGQYENEGDQDKQNRLNY